MIKLRIGVSVENSYFGLLANMELVLQPLTLVVDSFTSFFSGGLFLLGNAGLEVALFFIVARLQFLHGEISGQRTAWFIDPKEFLCARSVKMNSINPFLYTVTNGTPQCISCLDKLLLIYTIHPGKKESLDERMEVELQLIMGTCTRFLL